MATVTISLEEYEELKTGYNVKNKEQMDRIEGALDKMKDGNFVLAHMNILDDIAYYTFYGEILDLIKDIPMSKLIKIKFYRRNKGV